MGVTEKRTAFILAAGLGTRLKELTYNKPKALIEINKQTLLEVILERLISNEFNHLIINIHHFGDKIINFIKEKNYNNITVEISDERDCLMDTGGAILKAHHLMKNSKAVLIHNVDIITDVDYKSLYDSFIKSDDASWLLTQDRNNKRKLIFDRNDKFIGQINIETNKEEAEVAINNECKILSFSGIHLIKPEYFTNFELKACYVFDLYRQISEKHNVKSKFIQPEYWFDLGTQEQLKEASSWLLSNK